ncbi:hypothetical protein [Paenibacillus sp. Z6-24]
MEIIVHILSGFAKAANDLYIVAVGRRIHAEEQEIGRDLTYGINPFTGSHKS